MVDNIILKCETQKTFQEIKKKSNVWDLLLSVATTYSYNENRYRIWSFSKKDELLSYLNKKCIITYNGLRFDLPLLFGEDLVCDDVYTCTSKSRNIDFYCCDLFISIMRNVYRCDGYGELKNKMLKHPLSNMTSYSLYNIYTSTISKKLNKDIYNYNSADLFRTRKVLDLVEFNLLKNRMIKKLYEYIVEYKQIINGDYDVVFLGDIEKCSDDFIPF